MLYVPASMSFVLFFHDEFYYVTRQTNMYVHCTYSTVGLTYCIRLELSASATEFQNEFLGYVITGFEHVLLRIYCSGSGT